jgi:hypothetical protein
MSSKEKQKDAESTQDLAKQLAVNFESQERLLRDMAKLLPAANPQPKPPRASDYQPFDGTTDAKAWFLHAETVAGSKGNTTEQLRAFLPTILRDNAFKWFAMEKDKLNGKNYETFKAAVINEFAAKSTSIMAGTAFRHRRQQPSETARAFALELRNLAHTAGGKSDDVLIDTFIDGLHKPIQLQLSMVLTSRGQDKPANLNEAITIAESIEAATLKITANGLLAEPVTPKVAVVHEELSNEAINAIADRIASRFQPPQPSQQYRPNDNTFNRWDRRDRIKQQAIQQRDQPSGKWCSHHKSHSHNTSECRYLQRNHPRPGSPRPSGFPPRPSGVNVINGDVPAAPSSSAPSSPLSPNGQEWAAGSQ